MLAEVLDTIKTFLGFGGRNDTALDEAWWSFEQMLAARDKYTLHSHVSDLNLPAGISPSRLTGARADFAEKMYEHARDFMRRNPINMERLKTFTAKIGGMSDGLILASSKNPILQMVASLVTETTTGAAGRKSTAAIRRSMLEKKITGNAVLDYDSAWASWAGTNGVNVLDKVVTGESRRKFDLEVYEEILARRWNPGPVSTDPAILRAANSLEALFTRALKAQKDANTLGSARLPADSVGYVPQALDGRKLATADPSELDALEHHLAHHFATALKWDRQFAKDFALHYLQRARQRSMAKDSRQVDYSSASQDSASVIRETLESMKAVSQNPAVLSALVKAEAALSNKGVGHTKHRLDVDLLADLGNGKRVIDYYVTDPLTLARRYTSRTSGVVALTEYGIHGTTGAKHLRDSVTMNSNNGNEAPTEREIDAFDRIMAEMLGVPIKGEVVSRNATNLRLLVSIQRLGSMAYTQFAETWNMLHHLGLTSTLKGVASLPKMFGEVGRIKRGQDPRNHILTSIETWGGEIGSENYKLVMPLDPPDDRLAAYGSDPGLGSRLLNAGQHLQSKVSFFRGIMAAQHRAVAEQITLKAARYIWKGGNDIFLKDMGFTDELLNHFRVNMAQVMTWQNGKLVRFDLTRLPNVAAAEAFVQSVHRGVSQIIQGTFIGERNAWMHNDYLKLLLQLRTFSLTATEKQWGRTRMNVGGAAGYAYAAGALLGQMTLALPLHAARVHAASVAMSEEEKKKYRNAQLSPEALVRSTLNYSSLSGFSGDIMELLAGLSGGWLGKEQQELLGPRGTKAPNVQGMIPALGSVDQALRVVSGHADLNTALRQLPGSNLPYIIPIINATKGD
jgi:hypothetical protein